MPPTRRSPPCSTATTRPTAAIRSMLLLDSQVVLWVLDGNPRLGARARSRIAKSPAVHVSAASVWELTIKSMLGKLTIPAGFSTLLADQGFELLPITTEHAEAIRGL